MIPPSVRPLALLLAVAGCGCSSAAAPGAPAAQGSTGDTSSTAATSGGVVTSGGGVTSGTGGSGAGAAPGAGGAAATGAGGAGGMGGAGGGGATPAWCAALLGTGGATSAWVYAGANGKLVYKPLNASGDRIMDFSSAGYMGGGVALPTLPVQKTVTPSGKDDTAAIQAAIDAVSAMPASNGVRGAVLLAAGTFTLDGTLTISAGGVVLRGSGSGSGGTVVQVQGTSRAAVVVQGSGSLSTTGSEAITDAYVPSGATTFSVKSASSFAPGDAVLVSRPVTDAWIAFMGMDKLVRNGMPQTWIKAGSLQSWERTVTAVSGDQVTIDVPLSDSIDATYTSPPGAVLAKYTFDGRLEQVGVEGLRFVAPLRSASEAFDLIDMDYVVDGWVKDVTADNFTDGITIGSHAKRITVDGVALSHDPDTYYTDWAPFDFQATGSQTLVVRSSSQGGNKIWYYATHEARGPNVVLDFTGNGTNSHLAGHERWGTGLLVDRATVTGGIDFTNLGTEGTGHGWTLGWAVAWNCVSDTTIEAPPGSMSWAIGCKGNVAATQHATWLSGSPAIPAGDYDSQDTPVAMSSLYLAQLCERLGPQAVAAIGYP
jgi:hypothetical protein